MIQDGNFSLIQDGSLPTFFSKYFQIEVSAQNGRFTSNTFVVEVKTKHKKTVVENGSAFFFDTRVASSNGGAVSNNPKTEKSNNNNKSIILVLIVSGFAVASVLIGAVTIKFIR